MLRADVDGKIYVARVESGTVDVVDPQSGTVIRHVPLTGKNPTNLTFGGSDGKTVFVTQAKGGYVECQGRVRSGGSRHAAPPASWPALGRPSTPLPVQTPAAARAGGSLTLDGMKGSWIYFMSNRRNGVLYVGVTSSLSHRAWQHREGLIEGFTKRYGLKRLVYYERFEDIRDAIQREKTIKHWPRAWKVRLIHAMNPDWDDLYETLNQ